MADGILVRMGIDRQRAETLLRSGEEGVREWNELRRSGEAIPALDGVSLAGAILRGVDLRGANLSLADFTGSDLSGANLTNAVLRGALLSDAKILGANLSGAVLSGVDLSKTELLFAPGSTESLEQLKLFYDYTKWHVQLYAGSTLATLVLTELVKGKWVLLPLPAFLLAAACAGTLLGNVSRFTSEAALNAAPMEALGRAWLRFRGARVRFLEKVFFWIGVILLIGVVCWRPTKAVQTLKGRNPQQLKLEQAERRISDLQKELDKVKAKQVAKAAEPQKRAKPTSQPKVFRNGATGQRPPQ